MTHLLALCFEIVPAGFVGCGDTGNSLGHHDSGRFESSNLVRIVGQKPNGFNAEVAYDSGRQPIAAQIALETQLLVGFDGIGALVLKLVGAELIHEDRCRGPPEAHKR